VSVSCVAGHLVMFGFAHGESRGIRMQPARVSPVARADRRRRAMGRGRS
jgi:hypothetical protein